MKLIAYYHVPRGLFVCCVVCAILIALPLCLSVVLPCHRHGGIRSDEPEEIYAEDYYSVVVQTEEDIYQDLCYIDRQTKQVYKQIECPCSCFCCPLCSIFFLNQPHALTNILNCIGLSDQEE